MISIECPLTFPFRLPEPIRQSLSTDADTLLRTYNIAQAIPDARSVDNFLPSPGSPLVSSAILTSVHPE
jgi:hypothetical protein